MRVNRLLYEYHTHFILFELLVERSVTTKIITYGTFKKYIFTIKALKNVKNVNPTGNTSHGCYWSRVQLVIGRVKK